MLIRRSYSSHTVLIRLLRRSCRVPQQAKATVKARETASFSYVIAMGAALIFATACALTVLHFVRNLEDVCMD